MVKLALIICFCIISSTFANESDDFTLDHPENLQDAELVIENHFNQSIKQLVQEMNNSSSWYKLLKKSPQDKENIRKKAVTRLYHILEVNPVYQRTSRIVKKEVKTQKIEMDKSIYSDFPLPKAPVLKIAPLAFNIRVGNLVFGNDKLLHFITVGKQIFNFYQDAYKDSLNINSSYEAMTQEIYRTEHEGLGLSVTRVLSNGDIIADFEGAKFFDSLIFSHFNGQSFLSVQEGKIKINRTFDFKDYLSPFWSEAILPSYFPPNIRENIYAQITARCDIFENYKNYFVLSDAQWRNLSQRYSMVKIENQNVANFETLCQR